MKTAIFAFLVLVLFLPVSAQTDKIYIIVNVENPVTSITQNEISGYFLKKNKLWPNGVPVRFFDRNDESPARRIFLRTYIKRTVRDIELYWIGEKLYSGNSAPLQVSSNYMMASMVAKFPGALGYVSGEFVSAKGVKVIEVRTE